MSRSVSPEGLALIKGFEGFRAKPDQLPDGAWVVGYGHVRVGAAGGEVTEQQALELLALDLAPVEQSVEANTFQPLSQAQFDALCSFAFSIGTEAFETSAVLRRLNAGRFIAAACAMDAWRKSDAGGEMQIIEALIRRRAAEKAMFLCGTPCEAAPSAFVRAKLDYAAAVLGAPVDHKPAPEVTSAPRPAPKFDAGERLSEILKSEPATAALLLTQIAPDVDLGDDQAEIITAHAKPVARDIARVAPAPNYLDDVLGKFRPQAAALARNVRLSRFGLPANSFAASVRRLPRLATPQGAVQSTMKFLRFKFHVERPVEAVSLAALFAFGAGLVTLSAATLLGGRVDIVDVMGASALAAPGLFAIFLAVYGFMKGPAQTAA